MIWARGDGESNAISIHPITSIALHRWFAYYYGGRMAVENIYKRVK